jgi:UDP-N-acetylglucosamine 2-epimerase (non-hydrolysing)
MKKIKLLSIMGTRPEIIKMAPVLRELSRRSETIESKIVITGQHKEMSVPYLKLFAITPDYNLSIMKENQSLHSIVISVLKKLDILLKNLQPDAILVQGDTSSAFAATLSAFYNKIKIGHIEAGLRTYNNYNPFPEEANRHLISVLADLNFAPTKGAKENLLKEGISENRIFITGNTIIDALLLIINTNKNYKFNHQVLDKIDFEKNKIILVTTHRRESFGKPLHNILTTLKMLVNNYKNVQIILPVHYNPNVSNAVNKLLKKTKRIHLIEPLNYESFVHLMNKSTIILTDSGGIQEEAPSLGKPVLVLRDTTERPEGIKAGTAKIVGTDIEQIFSSVSELITNESDYNKMSNINNPYGDGKASKRIVEILEKNLLQTK